MLDSIVIKNVASYNPPGVQLNNLKKINFIYGANGSGKTTISKFIDEHQIEALYPDCSLIWKNGFPIKALVYNKDFREKNFEKDSFDGIFTLGEATKEDIESIKRMQIELEDVKNNGIKKREALEKQQEENKEVVVKFKEKVWYEIYKKYENDFKEAFKGVMLKEPFKVRLLKEFEKNNSSLKTFNELKDKAKIIFGEVPKNLQSFTTITFSNILEIEKNDIWGKKILGKSDVEIANLIQLLNINDWVNEGRSYLQDDDSTCPFCQQSTITDNFRNKLEEYFDESFTKNTKLVKEYAEEYIRHSNNLANLLSGIETAVKNDSETKLDIESFSAHLKTLLSQFILNNELLNNKIKEPSRSIELISVKEQLEKIQEIILKANDLIKQHNAIVANFSMERNALINSIWKYLIEEFKGTIENFNKKSNGLQTGIDNLEKHIKELQTNYKELDNKIKEANKNVTSVQPSVDEINKTLKSFGFTNFEIKPCKINKKQYQIQREDGKIVESTLSEGEITFITFLYFLQLAKGSIKEETITEERILVIDDPISSLDSNILFVVSSLVKEIIKVIKKGDGIIKQLILLTHNVYFHKEVSFIDGRTKEDGETFYYLLRKNNNMTFVQDYKSKNPIKNSYELLWQELRNRENNSGITIQNTMRRIIENYFKILGKYGDDDLIKKFDNKQEQEICRSLICWINDGSHCIPDDLYIEHQDATIDKFFVVFKSIFHKMGHPEHYKMMMREITE